MFGNYNLRMVRAVLAAIFMLCTVQLVSAAEFDVFDVGNTDDVGLIEVPCNPGTMIFLDGKYLLVTKAVKGVLLENVAIGEREVKTKSFSGKMMTYKLDVLKGDVASTAKPKPTPAAIAVVSEPAPALGEPKKLLPQLEPEPKSMIEPEPAPKSMIEPEPDEGPTPEERMLAVADEVGEQEPASSGMTEAPVDIAPVSEEVEEPFRLERTISPKQPETEPIPLSEPEPVGKPGPVLDHSIDWRGWNRLENRHPASFLISIEPLGIWSNPKADRFYTWHSSGGTYQEERMENNGTYLPALRMGVGINSRVVDTDILFGFGKAFNDDFDAPFVDFSIAPRFNIGPHVKLGPNFGLMAFGIADWHGESDVVMDDGHAYRIGGEICFGHRAAKFKVGLNYIRMRYDVHDAGSGYLDKHDGPIDWSASDTEFDLSGIYFTMGVYLRL